MDYRNTKNTMTHAEVTEHLRELRRSLSKRLTLTEIAAVAGVARQTLSQYCMMPGGKGARLIPGDKIDLLRTAVADATFRHWDRAQVPAHPRETRLWRVFGPSMDVILETTIQVYGEAYAARQGGWCSRGPDNFGKDLMKEDDWLRVRWLEARHGGVVTRADAMAVTETDEWTEGLVGFELPRWGIVPTAAEVKSLQAIHLKGVRHAA